MGWKFFKRLILISGVFILGACGSSREPIKSAVSSAFTAFQNFDEVTVERYCGQNLLSLKTILRDETSTDLLVEEMMPQLVERFSFRIMEVEENGENAIVKTEMMNVNMEEVLQLFLMQIVKDSFSEADLLGSGELSEEERGEKYHQMMTYIIHDEAVETVTNVVDVHLVFEEQSWKIVVDEELLNGLYGNLLLALNYPDETN